jgi:hypothetical protein
MRGARGLDQGELSNRRRPCQLVKRAAPRQATKARGKYIKAMLRHHAIHHRPYFVGDAVLVSLHNPHAAVQFRKKNKLDRAAFTSTGVVTGVEAGDRTGYYHVKLTATGDDTGQSANDEVTVHATRLRISREPEPVAVADHTVAKKPRRKSAAGKISAQAGKRPTVTPKRRGGGGVTQVKASE